MRSTRTFTSLALAFATLASAGGRLECLHTRSRDLAGAASCGDEGSLNYCFSHVSPSVPSESLSEELARCFRNAGCTADESEIEAFWVLRRCDTPGSDLRRGRRAEEHLAAAPQEQPFHARAMPTPTAMPMPVVNGPVLARQDNNPSTGIPTPCFTEQPTEITSCPVQATGPDRGRQLSCFPVTTSNLVCREGLICKSDNRGTQSCMFKQSSLGVAGVIIAIVFAAAVVISVFSICFFCCRERNEHRRIEKAAEAARIAKEAKTQATVAAKRPGAAVTAAHSAPVVEGQPLMYQQPAGGAGDAGMGADIGAGAGAGVGIGGASDQQQPPYPQQQYGGANPFADTHDGHPLR
ncbi:Extracellular membrane protein CFEM domain-containing protein [Madurella fahalii]|uniref:Extracellular membrane protein CFEM domain-containing protein n=1 Tax=Madurella fahalii TaxID=1157608 RepID=A0ABQ0GLJ6_9PEZI